MAKISVVFRGRTGKMGHYIRGSLQKKIGELCGKMVDTVSDIEEALTDYSETHNDMYLQFIEYTVIDD